MAITGFAFQGSLAEYLAMAVLFVHIVFALSHAIWILCRRETSDSWDSLSEIIAVAHNSRPSLGVLKNTSAGIEHLETYSQIAKILAIQKPGRKKFNHVEMIFLEEENEKFAEGLEPVDAVDNQLPAIPARENCDQYQVFEQSEEDLHFNDQHHYPWTWPGDPSSSDSSTVIVANPMSLARHNSTATLLSHKKSASRVKSTRVVENDREYG
jgi:hypothetical protein